jgi:hypothetical protein
MTDAPAPSPIAPYWDLLKSMAPSLGQCLVLIVTFATGVLTTVATQYAARPHIVIPAADPPRPVPMVSASDVDNIVNLHCTEVRTKVDEILSRIPPKRGGTK